MEDVKEEEEEGEEREAGEGEMESEVPGADELADRLAISGLLGVPVTSSTSSAAVDQVFRLLDGLKATLKEAKSVVDEVEKPTLFKQLVPPKPKPPPKDYTLTMSSEVTEGKSVDVFVRVGFLKMGEIQTAKEKYTCDVYVSAKWREPALDKVPLKEVDDLPQDFFLSLWNPQLFLENAYGTPKVKQWYGTWTSPQGDRYIHEQRIIHSVWSETLELWDFPFDTQDLSVTIGSGRRMPEVVLKEEELLPSAVVKDNFIDEQEWHLHDHVEVSSNSIQHWYTQPPMAQPFITFTTRVSRRLGYYYWHAFFCLLLIIFMTFTSFAVRNNPPDYRPYPPESGYERRLRLSYLLMLTSVSYKFYIGENLPRVSYFTRLDYYIFFSIIFNGVVSVWHGAAYWFEFCNQQVMYAHFFHVRYRPPEGLAPGRGNFSNCKYPFSLLQERYFIAACFGIVLLYNVYFFLSAHIKVRCRYREMLKQDKMYNLKVADLIRKGKIKSRSEIFKFPDYTMT